MDVAEGEYVIRLDADDYFDENILTVEASYLDANPEIDLVYPDYYTIDDDDAIINHVRNPEVGEEVKLLNRSPLAAGAMYRKRAWEAIGGYDESLSYQEDYDFWIRFINEFTVHNVNIPLMYYRQHDTNMSRNLSGRLEARNEVKRDFVETNLTDRLAETEVLCLVPAMAEQRFTDPHMPDDGPPLALREAAGKPLLEYTVAEALAADRIDRTIVSTEHGGIAEMARDAGADVPEYRPPELSDSTVPLDEVVQYHMARLRSEEGYEPDLVVLNQYVSPLTTAAHIDAIVDTWFMFSVDSVISVTQTNSFLWQPGKFGLAQLFEERLLREERETLYRENGALYAFTPRVVRDKNAIVGDHVGHLRLERHSAVHIDSWHDLRHSESLLEMDDQVLRPDYQSPSLQRDQ
ncbi:hypothetical protein VB779_16435 [Haloarculaceae archaeon H-GB11]|nr:hypothetical protein [Haloarculaceae archaeon H-GB11]